jgi:type II secretory pathway predicted ATPase ExeA
LSYKKTASAFLETLKSSKSSADEARQAVRKAMLEDAGFKEEEIAKLDLSQMTSVDFQKLVRERLFGALVENGSRQKVVPVDEVKNFLAQGYEYHATLGNGEAIVKLPI